MNYSTCPHHHSLKLSLKYDLYFFSSILHNFYMYTSYYFPFLYFRYFYVYIFYIQLKLLLQEFALHIFIVHVVKESAIGSACALVDAQERILRH